MVAQHTCISNILAKSNASHRSALCSGHICDCSCSASILGRKIASIVGSVVAQEREVILPFSYTCLLCSLTSLCATESLAGVKYAKD